MCVQANIYLRGMRDRSMRSGTELAREIQLTGPLEYKYRVIFVLVLGVICTLQSEVG
ncbi:hypothetical protein P5673_019266 [Acropora cervicornis]|uniref:Uncharacterized protein n=1 Tax=Acropora cervicornis TaxID=6130 RepID=A0AAD9QCT6_ACRCE|nr:hypothetical protein P5673_019266 [Acropora cervicornis]